MKNGSKLLLNIYCTFRSLNMEIWEIEFRASEVVNYSRQNLKLYINQKLVQLFEYIRCQFALSKFAVTRKLGHFCCCGYLTETLWLHVQCHLLQDYRISVQGTSLGEISLLHLITRYWIKWFRALSFSVE